MFDFKNMLFFAFLISLPGIQAILNLNSSSNAAVYWGQASGSLPQQNLAYYCQNSDIDVFILAFVIAIRGPGGVPEINFASAGNNCTTFPGTALLNCPQIGADIKTCQAAGKTIILSIGGSTYGGGEFTTTNDTIAAANILWTTFGPVTSDSSVDRPFGNAVVDGFDLDFEAVIANTAPFAAQLRSLMSTDTSRKYYLTVAPQCPYPDAADDTMLHGVVYFDAIWVQFYNNYCGLQSFVPGASTQNNFNFATWDQWAKNVSNNPNVKVFLGVPGNTGAAGSGYEPPSSLVPIISYCKQFSSFGGVMVWDAVQAYANNGFLGSIKQDLTSTTSRLFRFSYDSSL
ncbi:hypothetical protein Egran_00852 [Elaphomyces granulatus]|uniref:chitinase n=1 Tax=Elaphomyces granulatus TaxID=519963 RepID=A0A232M4S6_9EURO|nr:hypothetical protein Egran_00852 [Elaphomyces granulatus]